MNKVESLSLETHSPATIHRALTAACWPFGSLTPRVADLMLAYLGGMYSDDALSIEHGIALLREIRSVSGEWSEVLLGAGRVQLTTPTSRTVIELRGSAGLWSLTVDFGPHGSDRRADQILEEHSAPSDADLPAIPWVVTPCADVPHAHSVDRSEGRGGESIQHCDCGAWRMWLHDTTPPAEWSTGPAPGWEDRALERAKRGGVLR